MRFRRWQVQIAATLIVLAMLVYCVRWELFSGQTMHKEMLRYLVDDIALLFIQVLLVSLLLDGLLQRRARESMLTKLNMIIGAFFSECGTEILGRLAAADSRLGEVRPSLLAREAWSPRDYERAKHAFHEHRPLIDLSAFDLVALRSRLDREKSYLLGLLGNQALLEHEMFTDLLWAVTHPLRGARRPARPRPAPPARRGPHSGRRRARLHAPRGAVDRLPAAPADAVPVPLLAGGADQPARPGGQRHRAGLSHRG